MPQPKMFDSAHDPGCEGRGLRGHKPGAVRTDDVKAGRVLGLAGRSVSKFHKIQMQVRLACRI